MAPHRETSHAGPGRPVPDWDLAAFTPAGGLRSTAPDLVRFLGANLDPGTSDLAVPLEDVHRPRRSIGAHEDVGLGWHLREEGASTIAWHNGGTGGFGGFLAMLREHGAGVVVLYNSPPSPAVDAAGFGLLCDMFG
ncbi:MAG: serine hydrolase [Actinobacteria bacterium]|nr:serine hydrolase [Actinomycetota bacterium]